MSQEYLRVRDGKEIIKEIKNICGDKIIRDNRYFWKIEKDGKFDCFMIQNDTNDYYGISDAIKIYRINDEWYREVCQCLRNITDDKHARIYYKKKKTIYTAIYKI